MRILILGGDGYLGWPTAMYLANKNNEVLVKISGTGICGSDLHFFRNGALGSVPPQFPLSLGHETAGVIVDKNKSKFNGYLT